MAEPKQISADHFPFSSPWSHAPCWVALAAEDRLPVLLFCPSIVGVPTDLGIFPAERSGINIVADSFEPLIHLGRVLAHLADVLDGDLEVFDRLPDDP